MGEKIAMGLSLAFCMFFTKNCDVMLGRRNPACEGWSPIYIEESDSSKISESLSRQLLTHNLYGAKLCGWSNDKLQH